MRDLALDILSLVIYLLKSPYLFVCITTLPSPLPLTCPVSLGRRQASASAWEGSWGAAGLSGESLLQQLLGRTYLEPSSPVCGTKRNWCPGHQCHRPDLSHPCPPDLQPFMYGDYIAYDCWLGKVYDLKNQIILKLSNGARCGFHHGGAIVRQGQPVKEGRGCFLGSSRAVPGAAGFWGLESQDLTLSWSPCQPGLILWLSFWSRLYPGFGRAALSFRTRERC